MATIRPEVTGRAVGTGRTVAEHLEPLAVSPKTACLLLGIKNTYLYELLARGELRSYKDGKARKITTESIRARIAGLLAGEGATGAPARRGRGRPRKTPANEARA